MLRDTKALLAYEAKKKPQVAKAIEDADILSVEEIRALNFPKWIREEIEKIKTKKREDLDNSAYEQYVMDHLIIVDSFSPDIYGYVCIWNYQTIFIKTDRDIETELKENRPVFFPNTGGVWIDTIFSNHIDPRLKNLPIKKSNVSRTEYEQMWKAEIEKLALPERELRFSFF